MQQPRRSSSPRKFLRVCSWRAAASPVTDDTHTSSGANNNAVSLHVLQFTSPFEAQGAAAGYSIFCAERIEIACLMSFFIF
jgi:hypothetical protein